ncbi:glycosyl transferase family 1 [soil metagenome]
MTELLQRRSALKFLYLVPDLTDPAVDRRTIMFKAGGAEIRLAGFHRKPWTDDDSDVTPFGQTRDADLNQRLRAVVRWLLRPGDLRALAEGCDVIVARNLEMLLLGVWARFLRFGRPSLVYECLDIHAVMLGEGLKSKLLKAIEGLLLKFCRRIIVSSPAFLPAYFDRAHPGHPLAILVENKILALDGLPVPASADAAGVPVWTIGWFGMIRCRHSLDLLKTLTKSLPGRIDVVIRGRPTAAVFPNFAGELEDQDGVRFEGPYKAEDLAALYAEVDFVWAMDFYEAGQNSTWLLPNRLYEGGAFNVPALAQAGVETSHWLQKQDSGVIFQDPDNDLSPFFAGLSDEAYAALARRAAAVPRDALICDREACVTLVEALRP